jgi:hypothetical protein
MQKRTFLAAAVLVASITTAAYARTDFPIFVGKGEVQLAMGWNNKALQDAEKSGAIEFSLESVSETTWTCQKDGASNTQERTRATTRKGLTSYTARERNQFTGFWITGFNGAEDVSTDGPALGSCPTGWSEVPDSRETKELGGGILVNGVALQ